MKEIIVDDSTKKLGFSSGNLVVKNALNQIELVVSLNQLDSISVMGNPQITTQLIKASAQKKKGLHYFSSSGKYLCSLDSHQDNYEKQITQFVASSSSSFQLLLAKRIIQSKILAQMSLLEAYNQDNLLTKEDFSHFHQSIAGVKASESVTQLIGFEGKAAKTYFYYLDLIIDPKFRFKRRTKRPPLDPFNSMISYGYHLLYSYLIGAIKKYGLNAGIGCIHKNRNYHATLASDLMESWRVIIVDEVVFNLISTQAVQPESFTYKGINGVIMDRATRNLFLEALQKRVSEKHSFFHNDPKFYTSLYAIDLQIESLMRAYHEVDATLFETIGGRIDV
ncbi:CRISPR-associated endonuclease Cas1 [Fundicoccus ignavus]|uniref:CRISPR-associated endonuclease Cas1 n=1 Tax=Fundicoccus ignavus TaxID=2664442 RepID=UPI0016246C86|nr:CRISPR-associated endonuclease Cas1 [Fundicoccus ignavus]